MKYVFTNLLLFIAVLLVSDNSISLPRFALMSGAKCSSCHVNPTGGQMRNDFGTTYSAEKLPLEALRDSEFTFSGKLNENISIGGDYRSQFIYYNGSSTTTFQAMTTSIYGMVRLNKKYSFFFKQDIINGTYGSFYPGTEAFGLAKILPNAGYVKGGIFLPNYGLRLDDHTAYTRGGSLGFIDATKLVQHGLIFVPNYKDIGLEIGEYFGDLFVTAGLFNGTGNSTPIKFSSRKAFALKAEYAGTISDVNFNIGGSAYGYDVMSMQGLSAGIAVGDFTLLGEIDWTNNYMPAPSVSPNGQSLAAYAEIDFRATPGVWLTGAYDVFDPNNNSSVTGDAFRRITLGMEFFPYSFVELRPQYRINMENPSADNDLALVQMHLWF